MFNLKRAYGVLFLSLALFAASAHAQTVKIAFIDPLSGLLGPVGQNNMRSWQWVAEVANQKNWAGKVKFEIVPFDNKLSPQESLNVLKRVEDEGIRYIVQGDGSSVALALEDAVDKYNARNPGKEILYLNYAAVDPALTNEKCTYWHFALDINANMKMEALTTYLAKDQNVKKVYLINQNYSFGQAVAHAAKEYLARKRPDIKIVGDDLHPLAQIKDFAPYVAKIKASGADTVITGNWGSDLALLIKAAKDAGLNVNFYTYYASTTGVPTAMGAAGEDKVYVRRILEREQRDNGVVAASGGNAGLAVAYAARELGFHATIFVPETAPAIKVTRLRGYGAEVRQVGATYAEALAAAQAHGERSGAVTVHAYDQPEVVAGQGTLGRELEAQLEMWGLAPVHTVPVPVGGGGVIGGIAGRFAVGSEWWRSSRWRAHVRAGSLSREPVDVEVSGRAADWLGAQRIGEWCWAARDWIAGSVLVADDVISEAQRRRGKAAGCSLSLGEPPRSPRSEAPTGRNRKSESR